MRRTPLALKEIEKVQRGERSDAVIALDGGDEIEVGEELTFYEAIPTLGVLDAVPERVIGGAEVRVTVTRALRQEWKHQGMLSTYSYVAWGA